MQTWKKATVAITVILILILGWLYFRGAESTQPEEGERPENPIFPFESGDEGSFFGGDEETLNEDEGPAPSAANQPQLWQVSDSPIAGAGWVSVSGGDEEIWFVSRANGHIYSVDSETREETRITNTTIPQVREALISPTGERVIFRYLDDDGDIKTYAANLDPANNSEVTFSVSGLFLPDNITNLSLSPAGDQLFYLQPAREGVIGVAYTLETKETEVIFESAASEWRGSWTTPEHITLYTAADAGSTGFVYQVNLDGSLEKLAEGRGITANVNPDNTYLLSSQAENSQYRAQLQEIGEEVTLMSPPTLSEKCGWAAGEVEVFFCGIPEQIPSNNPLKDWYQGRLSFDDNLVLFNPQKRNQSTLFTEEELEEGPFDITEIKTDTSFNTVIFTNKRTNELWAFRL